MKKTLALVLAILMALSLLSACSKAPADTTDPSTTEATKSADTKPADTTPAATEPAAGENRRFHRLDPGKRHQYARKSELLDPLQGQRRYGCPDRRLQQDLSQH